MTTHLDTLRQTFQRAMRAHVAAHQSLMADPSDVEMREIAASADLAMQRALTALENARYSVAA